MSEEKIYKFYWKTPRDIIAITHGGQFSTELFPTGIPSFIGTPIQNQLAMMATVVDENDKAIGALSELEVFGRNGETDFDVYLTMVFPDRGALFVRQIKSMVMPDVVEPYSIAATKGEWSGNIETIHTTGPLPGQYGEVLAGTGEFAGMTGRHQQTAVYKHIKGDMSVVEVCETFLLTSA